MYPVVMAVWTGLPSPGIFVNEYEVFTFVAAGVAVLVLGVLFGVAVVRWFLKRRERGLENPPDAAKIGRGAQLVRRGAIGCSILAVGISGFEVFRNWEEIDSAVRVWLKREPTYHLAVEPPKLETVPRAGSPSEDFYLLVTSMFEDRNAMRLIDHQGRVVQEWIFDVEELFPEAGVSNFRADLHGSLVLPDGSAVANFEYIGLARLDRNGEPVFTLSASTQEEPFEKTHHSVHLTERGTFWVGGKFRRSEPHGRFDKSVEDDILVEVDQEGKVLRAFSLLETYLDSGFELENVESPFTKYPDVFHLNDIEELSSEMAEAFPMFEAGDLLVSLRETESIMVIDPDTRRVKWHAEGDWVMQHDPDFQPDGTITLYDNQADRGSGSRILELDPETKAVSVKYHAPDFYSRIRGKHEVYPDGTLLITEFQRGRVFLVDAGGIVRFEYVNPRVRSGGNGDQYYEITKAELIPKDYFDLPPELDAEP